MMQGLLWVERALDLGLEGHAYFVSKFIIGIVGEVMGSGFRVWASAIWSLEFRNGCRSWVEV